jgi:hypothetical protein
MSRSTSAFFSENGKVNTDDLGDHERRGTDIHDVLKFGALEKKNPMTAMTIDTMMNGKLSADGPLVSVSTTKNRMKPNQASGNSHFVTKVKREEICSFMCALTCQITNALTAGIAAS